MALGCAGINPEGGTCWQESADGSDGPEDDGGRHAGVGDHGQVRRVDPEILPRSQSTHVAVYPVKLPDRTRRRYRAR
jgi:hypothetical protein